MASVVALALSGCAPIAALNAGETVRSAAAGISKGVRVCITNNTEKPMKIKDWFADTHDSLKNNILETNATACGEGTSSFYHWDTSFLLTWRDNTTKSLYFGNQFIGWPFVTENPERRTAADGQCGFEMEGPNGQDVGVDVPCSDQFRIGETRGYVHTAAIQHLVNVTRLADTRWIEFQVNVIR